MELAHLLAEDRGPSGARSGRTLGFSGLIEYEIWTRIHDQRLACAYRGGTDAVITQLALVDLAPVVPERALAPVPPSVRTLDSLPRETWDPLQGHGQRIGFAKYDQRMATVVRTVNMSMFDLEA